MYPNVNEILYANETLTTPRLTLRKFRLSDAPDILEYASDSQTLEHLVWSGSTTLEQACANITDSYWSRPGIYAITLTETGKCIGGTDLRIIREHDKANFGYVLNHTYWSKGYMTEALHALLTLCFETLDANRVEAEHFTGNEASGRVMEKCGMILEGIGIQEQRIKGIFRDVAHYGITKAQWQSAHKI